MTTSRKFIAAFIASCFFAFAAFAGDPAGTWTWSQPGRDGQTFEQTLKLEHKDGKLTGTITGRGGERPISEGTVKDDTISFAVEREFNGNKVVTKYTGKLAGDTITGSSEGSRGGEVVKRDWTAKRAAK